MSEILGVTKAKIIIDPAQVQKDLYFAEATLDDAMYEQASLYARYSTLAVEAQQQLDNMKSTLDVREARLSKEIRDAALDTGNKITEGGIETALKANPELHALRLEINTARAQAELAKGICESFRQRRDMLQQLSAHRREERQGEMRLAAIEQEATLRGLSASQLGKALTDKLKATSQAA